MLSDELRKKMLEPPSKPVQIVLDTDAAAQIDDQFAIAYALLSSEEIKVEAINAAPLWHPEKFAKLTGYPDPESGMEASYQEILTVLEKMGVKGRVPAYRGSKAIMKSPDEPVQSEAAENIIRLAMQEREQPLYVVAIGAVTNVTSAILMEPEIKERIVVEWLGGHPTYWYTVRDSLQYLQRTQWAGQWEPSDFNAWVDPLAAMTLFDSGVPIVWMPCINVAQHLRTVPCEIERYVRGQGDIGDYLADLFKDFQRFYWISEDAISKVQWDMTNIGYLVNPEWVPTKLTPAPKLNIEDLTLGKIGPKRHTLNPDNLIWCEIGPKRHTCRTAIHLQRDPILLDFFKKLEKYAKGEVSLGQ